jgi:hypothetical protein
MEESASSDPGQFIFAKVMNRHGYPFQYRSLRAAEDANKRGESNWLFQASEVPVEVRGRHTGIDFVLQYGQPHALEPTFLVVECKRANPAMKCWAFAKAPFVRRNYDSDGEYLIREEIHYRSSPPDTLAYAGIKRSRLSDAYRIALEIKIPNVKGDSEGAGGNEAIEAAATQVSLAVSGLIQLFRVINLAASTDIRCQFIPVIVTTAQLYVSDVDLTEGDLETGEIKKGGITNWREEKWLYYQYPVSPGIKHNLSPDTGFRQPAHIGQLDLGASVERDFVRTIAIVQGKHFENFLSIIDNKL